MLIAVDVDGVICDIISPLLSLYNTDYGDNLCYEEITEWDVSKFVLPECGKKIFEYFSHPCLYRHAELYFGAKEGIEQLRGAGHRVIFVTTPSAGTEGRKIQWLNDAGIPCIKDNYIECHDKSLIRADVLIDDGVHNLRAFIGKRVLFDQPWNKDEYVDGAWLACNWGEIPQIIQDIQDGQ